MNCKNCEFPLSSNDKFCSNCGAKVITNRITLRYIASEVYEGFLSIDSSKPIRTFLGLFSKPEVVIGSYIDGTRKKYINAFGYFTIAVTLSSFFWFVFSNFFPASLESLGSLMAKQNPNDPDVSENVLQATIEYQTLISFASIPLLALISRIVFLKNKKYNFAEHLLINMYAYSHGTIVMTLIYFLTIPFKGLFAIIAIVSVPAIILYYSFVLKRLYSLSIIKTILKTLLFIPIMLLFYLAIIICIGIYMFLTGSLQPS